jgi:hypothetical protein
MLHSGPSGLTETLSNSTAPSLLVHSAFGRGEQEGQAVGQDDGAR